MVSASTLDWLFVSPSGITRCEMRAVKDEVRNDVYGKRGIILFRTMAAAIGIGWINCTQRVTYDRWYRGSGTTGKSLL